MISVLVGFLSDMQISLILKIQSISVWKSSCENFCLLAEAKCHAFWKMIVCVPINTFKKVKNLRFLQNNPLQKKVNFIYSFVKNQNLQIILLYVVNTVSISQVLIILFDTKSAEHRQKCFQFNKISGDFMTTETFRSCRLKTVETHKRV